MTHFYQEPDKHSEQYELVYNTLMGRISKLEEELDKVRTQMKDTSLALITSEEDDEFTVEGLCADMNYYVEEAEKIHSRLNDLYRQLLYTKF